MKLRIFFASLTVGAFAALGIVAAIGSAAAATNSSSVPVEFTCTSTGQACDAGFQQPVTTTSVLTVEFESAFNGCATFSVTFLVDGAPKFTSAPLGQFTSTGPIDLGPVTAGSHVVEVRATGVTGGCDNGTLLGWSGRVSITTNDDPVVTPTPTDPPGGTPPPTPPADGSNGPKGDCKDRGWTFETPKFKPNFFPVAHKSNQKDDRDNRDRDDHDNRSNGKSKDRR